MLDVAKVHQTLQDVSVCVSSCLLPLSSGADLSALVREAALAALKEHMGVSPVGQWQQERDGGRGEEIAVEDSSSQTKDRLFEACCVKAHHFETAFSKVKASVSGKVAGHVNG